MNPLLAGLSCSGEFGETWACPLCFLRSVRPLFFFFSFFYFILFFFLNPKSFAGLFGRVLFLVVAARLPVVASSVPKRLSVMCRERR